MTILVEEGQSVEIRQVVGMWIFLRRVLVVGVLAGVVLLSSSARAFLCKNAAGYDPQLGCVPTAIGAPLPTGLMLPQMAQCECNWHTKFNSGMVTLNSTPVIPGVYGDTSHVPQITLDAAGRVTNAASVGIATGGNPGFNQISSGTNSTAAMVCDTGCSVNPANSGVVNANQLKGTPINSSTPSDTALLIANGTQWSRQVLSGDISNTNTGVTSVLSIRGGAVSNAWATPTAGQVIVGSGAAWIPRTLSGDVAGVSNVGVVTLSSIISPATVGDASHIPIITYDAKGRVTATSTASPIATADCSSTPLLCLAGRAGTGNDAILSTTGDGTITGSTVANKGLKLIANSVGNSSGLNAGSGVWITGVKNLNDGQLSSLYIDNDGMTLTGSAVSEFVGLEIGTHPPGVDGESTWSIANTSQNTLIGVDFTPLITTPNNASASIHFLQGFRNDYTYQTGTNAMVTTPFIGNDAGFYDAPIYEPRTGATLDMLHAAVYSKLTLLTDLGGGFIGQKERYGLYYDSTGSTQKPGKSEGVHCATDDNGSGTYACVGSVINSNATRTNHAFEVTGTATSRIVGPVRLGDSVDPNEKLEVNGNMLSIGVAFASLGTPVVGAIRFCTNCTLGTDPCAASGGSVGTFAFRINAGTPKWKCL